MDCIAFSTPERFTPNLASIPSEYEFARFSDIDLSGRQKLKSFLVDYLKSFSYAVDGITFDSLVLGPGELAFKLLVALYREIGSRVTLDHYRFIHWSPYISELRSLGYQAGTHLYTSMEDVKFVFIFDLNFLHKESITHFCELLDICHTGKIKMFCHIVTGKQIGRAHV